MYCFPYPKGADVAPLRVPYVAGTCKYSLTGPYTFDTFYETALPDKLRNILSPETRSPIVRELLPLLLPPSPSVIQAWLFFGLASEALGRDVAHQEFFESHQQAIDLRIPGWFWSELKARWKHLRDTTSSSIYRQKQEHLRKCYDFAMKLVGVQDSKKENAQEDGSQLPCILLSVHMLLYLISNIFVSAKLLRTDFRLKSTQLLVERMVVENGWCRKRLNFLDSIRLFYPALYFMASFRPPGVQTDSHRSCTATKCHVTTGLAQPLHRTPGCQCQDIHVPLEQVLNIVAAGGIPLIRITRLQSSGDFQLEVVPYTRALKFVAISHVWADRQFGSAENSLPSCQVEYLDSTIAQLPPNLHSDDSSEFGYLRLYHLLRQVLEGRSSTPSSPIMPSRAFEYFWLDTFCIPQDPEHSDLKNKAIGSMNLIYAAAANTLVFDSALQKLDAGQLPSSLVIYGRPTFYAPNDEALLDVTAHICASNWMGRAWTLQEAVLSGHLVFPLKGSLAFLRVLRPRFDKGLSMSEFANYLIEQVHGWLDPDMEAHIRDDSPQPGGHEPMWNHVRHNILKFAETSLNVEEHRNYARGTVSVTSRQVLGRMNDTNQTFAGGSSSAIRQRSHTSPVKNYDHDTGLTSHSDEYVWNER